MVTVTVVDQFTVLPAYTPTTLAINDRKYFTNDKHYKTEIQDPTKFAKVAAGVAVGST